VVKLGGFKLFIDLFMPNVLLSSFIWSITLQAPAELLSIYLGIQLVLLKPAPEADCLEALSQNERLNK
jgi:hypothetical protein